MTGRMMAWIGSGRNGLWLGLVLFCSLVALGWVGFLASDDVTYAIGAYGWIEQFPFVGGHGTIRYPITIPMAISFLTFGENEFAMVLPSLLYMLGFLVLIWHAVRHVGGTWAATSALAVLAISPLLVIQSSIASIDIVEMAFLFASVLLFWRCLDSGPDTRRLFAAGVTAGLAFLTRETAIFVAVFYAILFLAGHRFHRGHYLWIAAGFLAIWAVEVIYLWAMTGDPLYRITISLNHDSSIDRTVDVAGNTVIHPLIDPLLVLLVNQEFMALFFIAIPLGAWLCVGKSVEPRIRHFSQILSLFGLSWFLCAAAAQHLLPLNPRYFMITTAVACVLTGIGLATLATSAQTGPRVMVYASVFLILGGNFAGIYLENKDSLYGARQLAAIAAANPDAQIVTDPMTRYRADMLLKWEDAQARISDRPPAPGDLFFYNPGYADRTNFKMSAEQTPQFQPGKNAKPVARYEPEPIYVASLIEAAGLAEFVPGGIWQKIRYRHPAVTLYRIDATAQPGRAESTQIEPGETDR